MAQERAWRPADYWPQAVYLPPRTREFWAFEAPDARGSAERARVRRAPELGQQRSRETLTTAARIVAWMLACGLVVGVVAALVAVFVLHLG